MMHPPIYSMHYQFIGLVRLWAGNILVQWLIAGRERLTK